MEKSANFKDGGLHGCPSSIWNDPIHGKVKIFGELATEVRNISGMHFQGQGSNQWCRSKSIARGLY